MWGYSKKVCFLFKCNGVVNMVVFVESLLYLGYWVVDLLCIILFDFYDDLVRLVFNEVGFFFMRNLGLGVFKVLGMVSGRVGKEIYIILIL